MQSAQLRREHSAYGRVMQAAYARPMTEISERRRRRQGKLIALLEEIGGPTKAAEDTGTPRSHISAMKAGTRGVGDGLAAKLERQYGKPPGWFDDPLMYWPFSEELWFAVQKLQAQELEHLEGVMRAHLRMSRTETQQSDASPEQTDQGVAVKKDSPSGSRARTRGVKLGTGNGSKAGGKQPGGVQKPGRGGGT